MQNLVIALVIASKSEQVPALEGKAAPDLQIPCRGSLVHHLPKQSTPGLNMDFVPARDVRASTA